MATALLFGVFGVLLIIGVPVAFALSAASLATVLYLGMPSLVVVQQLAAGASVGGEARQLARWPAGPGWRWCSPGPAHRAGEVRCCAGREAAGAARRCRGRFLAHV